MKVTNNFKNIKKESPLNQSPNINHKSKEHKKKRKKNSYTDNFIDKKRLTIESTKETIKIPKRNPSTNNEKTSNNNSINNNKKNINYHIKHQNKQKYMKKSENMSTPIIKSKNNTNNTSHNLNSNIILINNNNINYSNKNENNENITHKNIIVNDNKDENSELNKDSISNGDLIYKNKFKNLLISNISTLTNNISNIFSNNEQNINNNMKKRNNPYLNSKINEYCYKNKLLTNSSNEETYSKGKISTNYNNDLEINISDIKFSKTKKEKENKYQPNKSENEKVKKLKYNDSYYKLSENNIIKKEENKSENYNTTTNYNEEEIKEVLNLNIETENNQKEELNDSEYKIYEVNNITNHKKEKNNLNLDFFTTSEHKKGNINDFLDANTWLENENEKEPKINLDDYINKAKEKLSKIRYNNIEEKNILNKKKIKSTLNYILNKNNKDSNINSEYDLDINKTNEINKPNNLKGSLMKNKSNKYVIKTSNRMQNFFNINLNEYQKNKVAIKQLSKSKINSGVPNIKAIGEEKMEVFDEEEFMQIKKRNLSSKKTKIKINLDEDFKKLNRNSIKYRNLNKDINNDNAGNKTINGENILPPNNLNLKSIFNQNIVKTILKSKVNF